jgi:hypothetical protein
MTCVLDLEGIAKVLRHLVELDGFVAKKTKIFLRMNT